MNNNTENKLCKLTNGLSMSQVNIQFSAFTDSYKNSTSGRQKFLFFF